MTTYHYYQLFHFTVVSEILLPELVAVDPVEEPDMTISLGIIPDKLQKTPAFSKVCVEYTTDEYVLRLPQIANYYACHGSTIIIEPCSEDEPSIRLFLLDTLLVAILYQKGLFLLQASAVAHQGKAVVIAGKTGLGKSSTVAALFQKNYKLLSDGLSLILWDKDNKPVLQSAYPYIKLWKDVLDTTTLAAFQSQAIPLRTGIQQFGISLKDTTSYLHETLPIEKLYIIGSKIASTFEVKRLTVADAQVHLVDSLPQFRFLQDVGQEEIYLDTCTQLAESIPITLIDRFEEGRNLDERMALIVDFLEQDFNVL